MFSRLSLGTLIFFATADAYIWPSPQLDALDSARFDQEGFNANASLMEFIQPCDTFLFGGSNTGRSDAADWIRTTYHDVATHNITDGTGGLDASIRFAEEQARAENVGDGFSNTILIVFLQVTRYISISDSLALGTLIAIENCGGPEIAFRGGRIDAAQANAPGVPEPQQDLDSHTAAFARHNFGGVQHAFFPDIVNVLNDTTDTDDVAHFDSTYVTFDNNGAMEYISGTTQNPLIVGFNDTPNSDKRIFGSDGNVTLLSFAKSLELFASTCAHLFARMLDTVPSSVQLTDVITPLPVKPTNVVLVMDGDTLQLFGQVRLWNMTEDPNRIVNMLWDDHVGGTGNATLGFAGLGSSTGGKYTAAFYGFNAADATSFLPLDAAAGVQSLSFVVNGQLEDQGGLGFPIQDGFMFSQTSCRIADPPTGRIDVAVRNGVNATRVYLEQSTNDSVQRVVVTQIEVAPPSQPIAPNSAYSLWTVTC
ncbi:heme peroxidase [Mycena galopus ATCC 62051]|nr:heme peroxidase [Mycena galopus ATCC 62051]